MTQALELPPPRADGRPSLSIADASRLARRLFGQEGPVEELPSYADQNFRVGPRVLKVAHVDTDPEALAAQDAAVRQVAAAVPTLALPMPVEEAPRRVACQDGRALQVRLVDWVDGVPLAEAGASGPERHLALGVLAGQLRQALERFAHPGSHRALDWDLLRGAAVVERGLAHIGDRALRRLVEGETERVARSAGPLLPSLPTGVVHNDLNDHNVLVADVRSARIVGLLDFGDLVHTVCVAEPVIAATYALLDDPDPVGVLAAVLEGYRTLIPLSDVELECILALVRLRLCVSVAQAARTAAGRGGGDAYLDVSQAAVRRTLAALALVDDGRALARLEPRYRSRTRGTPPPDGALREARARTAGPALSLSYQAPLHIVRGRGARLYDRSGRAYLDCVNNVAHVGHEHPRVVAALAEQAALLNTNTRYLHELLPLYGERLLERFGPPFEVCWLVCSGSEANELALRMARAATGARNVVVLDAAYHGNTSALVEMSPYKYKGPGGFDRPAWVQEAPLPDPFRGRFRDPDTAADRYLEETVATLDRARAAPGGLAAFFAEAMPSCGGQVVPPAGWLARAFEATRSAGGVAVADEVQVGFGRVGSHWWGFEAEGAVPDIVTLGKPIGNGHPLGAVVTTRAVAEAFSNGMEYFNTFGGNPVSCAVGLAVLDVLEDEGLRAHAAQVGDALLGRLRPLAERVGGQARGRGLFLGLELTRDGRSPDPERAARLVERLVEREGILLSTDGPDHNVLKIKPPLVFSHDDAARLVEALERALEQDP